MAVGEVIDEYERGERKGYDAKMTPRMIEIAKQALAAETDEKEK